MSFNYPLFLTRYDNEQRQGETLFAAPGAGVHDLGFVILAELKAIKEIAEVEKVGGE